MLYTEAEIQIYYMYILKNLHVKYHILYSKLCLQTYYIPKCNTVCKIVHIIIYFIYNSQSNHFIFDAFFSVLSEYKGFSFKRHFIGNCENVIIPPTGSTIFDITVGEAIWKLVQSTDTNFCAASGVDGLYNFLL